MDKTDIYVIVSLLFLYFLFACVLLNLVFADSIHIDDYRPIGRESVIQVDSFGIIHNKYTKIQTNVTVSINNMTYSGETNKYGYIAFPIVLTDNVFEAGTYDVIIQIGENIHKRILHVLKSSY